MEAGINKDKEMKKILCYGDSNTFGFNPTDNSRYDENTRWASVLQKILGEEYKIVNEGMCDRTGFVNNPKGYMFSGPKHFPKIISKAEDIDLLILWVGSNDLQNQYDISMGAVEKGLETLVKLGVEKAKNIIIIPSVILSEKVLAGPFSFQFNETSVVKSRKVGKIFRTIANVYKCAFFDVNKIVAPSDFDGLHYDENGHKLIAENLAEFIKQKF